MGFRSKGFSTLEMVIAAGMIMMLGYLYSLSLRGDLVNQEGNQLATQTLSYAKTYAKYLGDLQSGNLYLMGSGNNCIRYNPFMSGNTTVIGLSDLTQNFGKRYYDPNDPPDVIKCTSIAGSYKNTYLNEKNSFRQTPCLGVTKNIAGKLQAFLFYVDNGSNTTSLDYVRNAMIRLNGKGGYFENNGTVRSNGGWNLGITDPRFADPGHCGGSRISPNSLVVNMDQFVEFNDQLSNSVALNRESDIVHQPGTLQNTNTSKTDIYMSSNNGTNHQIVLDKLNNVTLSTSGSTVTLNNGDFQPDSLQGTKQVVSGAACDVSEVGAMAQQADPNARSIGIQQGEAICTDSQLICALYGSRYCWLPAKGNTITYSDAAHTGRLGTRLVCPAYAPFMTYAKGYQQGNANVTIENIITPINNPNTGKTYNLARGAKAIGDNSPVGCEIWGYTAAYGDNNWGRYSCQAGTTYHYPGNCGLSGGTAACDGVTKNGNQGWYGRCRGEVQIGQYNCANAGCAGKDWTCTKQGVTPPVMLETVTCTSKLVIQAS